MHLHTFTERDELESALLSQIQQIAESSIQSKGNCTILFSGGSTPKALMNKLATSSIDWTKIQIGLVDDRMVDKTSSFSNLLLLENELLRHIDVEKRPSVIPLVTDHQSPDDNLKEAQRVMRSMAPIDICLLGMGTDGHFASIFPNDSASQKAIMDVNGQDVYLTNAPAHPVHRITCSWPFLAKSKHLFLHITGDTKYQIIKGDMKTSLPIHQVLEHNCALFWAP